MSKTVVGLFRNITEAQSARQELITQGYAPEDIRVVTQEQDSFNNGGHASGSAGASSNETGILASIKHFFGSLTDADEDDREYYSRGVTSGGALLSATVPDERAESTRLLLEQYGATDYENAQGGRTAGRTAAQTGATAASDNVAIPVVEEELQVGKRQVSRGGVRVYSRVVETPVEEDVRLREEHVRVQRNPVNRPASEADFQAFKEGAIELTESAEEAVVSKQARVVEEVVVGKEVSERTQTIRDSVRQTEVEVEELGSEASKKSTTSGR